MKGLTHLAFGVATGVATATIMGDMLTQTQQIAFITGSGFGAILVDIDSEKTIVGNNFKPFSSMLQKKFGHRVLIHSPFFLICFYLFFNTILTYGQRFHNIIGIILGIASILFIGTLFISNFDFDHIVKSLLILLVLPLTLLYECYQSPQYAFYGIILGWIGHLFLDILTKGGLPLFFPLKFKDRKNGKKKIKKISLFCFKSCSWYESFVAMFLFILFFVGLVTYHEHATALNNYDPVVVVGDFIYNKIINFQK